MGFPDSPFNYSSTLQDLLSQSEDRIDGLNAQRQSLVGDYNAIEQDTSAEGAGAYGSILIPFLAGYLGSGGGGDGLTSGMVAAGKAGETYYNNLDADEKARKALNLGEQQRLEKERADQINFSQQLTGYGVQRDANQEDNYLTGKYPGTEPYNEIQSDQKELAQTRANAAAQGRITVDRARMEAKAKDPTAAYTADEANAAFEDAGISFRTTEPMSVAKVNGLTQAKRTGIGAQSLTLRQNVQDENLASKTLFGAVDIPGVSTSPASIDRFKANTALGYQKAQSAIDQLKSGAIEGMDDATKNALAYNLWSSMRIAQGTGAHLTGREPGALGAFVPILSNPLVGPDNAWEYMQGILIGRDDPSFINDIESILKKTYAKQLLVVGKALPDKSLYSPEDIAELEGRAKTRGVSFPWGGFTSRGESSQGFGRAPAPTGVQSSILQRLNKARAAKGGVK